MFLKDVAKTVIDLFPEEMAAGFLAAKHRLWWRTKGSKLHLAYAQDYKTRSAIVSAVKEVLHRVGRDRARIIEFGCSGGNNLRLMREILPWPVSYLGLDFQPDAIAYARQQYPEDVFHVCDDLGLPDLVPRLGPFDVFIASAVLYYIPLDRAQTVLRCAACLADYVVVCDDLSRFHLASGRNDGLFLPPYAALCRKAGLEIVVSPERPEDPGNRHGYFVARSAGRFNEDGVCGD